MINLKFMNKAVELTDGNEFRLLYVIANTISLKKEGHTKIYRDMLSDMLNLSTKQITRLTNSLVEKGLLKKDLVFENGKSVCYYSLNLDKNDKKSTLKVDKNVPLNNIKKNVIKEIKINNKNNIKKEENNILNDIIKEEKIDNIEEFEKPIEKETKIDFDWETELEVLQRKIKNSSTCEELKILSTKFNEMQEKVEIPTELKPMVDELKNTASSKVWLFKAKQCYS